MWDGSYHLTPNLLTTDQQRHWFAMASHTNRPVIKVPLSPFPGGKQPVEATENGLCRYAQIDAWTKHQSGGFYESKVNHHPSAGRLTA